MLGSRETRLSRGVERKQTARVVCAADRAAVHGGEGIAGEKPPAIKGCNAELAEPSHLGTNCGTDAERVHLPQGLLGQAIDYTLKRWDALTRFVDDGLLEIDNNLIENAIRPMQSEKRTGLSSVIRKPENAAQSFTHCWAVVGGMGSTRSST